MTDEEREEAYSALNARLMELAPTIYGYDRQSIFAASNRVNVPALSSRNTPSVWTAWASPSA
jgi:peptide/nickel transport system substrate-binding protein